MQNYYAVELLLSLSFSSDFQIYSVVKPSPVDIFGVA